MINYKQAIRIGFLMLLCIGIACIWFGNGKISQGIKKAISVSIEEDFKIKESLGQLFLLENDSDNETISVGAGVNVSEYVLPVKGSLSRQGTYIKIDCDRYASVSAVCDGVVESVEADRITLRHNDGKKSVYKGITAYVKKGEKVYAGQNIGYADENLLFALYENSSALDPMEYFS